MLRKKLYTQILSIFFALLIFTAACGRTGRADESRPDEGGTPGLSAESVTLSESVPVTEADAAAFPKTCKPAFFSFSGGTGKVTITCPEVTIKSQTSNQISNQISSQTSTQINGQISDGEKDKNRDKIAEAVLVFSSPHYEWVKSDGIEYLPDNTEESNRETSIFTIPVLLDEEMKISALTTAMSEPHEIEYTIFISLNEETQDSPNTDALENIDTSEKTDAPEKADASEETDAPEKAVSPEGTNTPEKTGALEKSETSILPDSKDEEIYDREKPENHTAPEIPGLAFVSEKELAYAEAFAVYNYRVAESGVAQDVVSNNTPGGVTIVSAGDTSGNITTDVASDSSTDGLYRLIDVYGNGGARYLLVPEGAEIPKELQKALQQEQQKTPQKEKQKTLQNEQKKTLQQEQQKTPQQEQQKALQQEQQETLRGEKDSPANINKNTDSSAITGKITVLQAPLDNLYVAATSSMALFDAAGAISQVKLTGTDAKGWYIDAPRQALENGSMVYAGKYSAPDYELLTVSGCDLAVESMMILHTPEVKEKLEELGIPVFIDTSSSETHPMGRTEWVRLYGILTGHEKEADEFFEKQIEIFAESDSYTDTGKTTAFFSITSNGNVIVRAADDYIPKMISLAGGHYIFTDLTKGTGNSASVRLSMEDFYNTAKDADYLIYNATIEKPVGSIRELCSKFALLSEFKAVQEGHVWQVRSSLYQSPDIAARMITDLRSMLTEQNGTEMTFLEPVSD